MDDQGVCRIAPATLGLLFALSGQKFQLIVSKFVRTMNWIWSLDLLYWPLCHTLYCDLLYIIQLTLHLSTCKYLERFCSWNQNCKQLFMYMNNWYKGVAPVICPRILSPFEYRIWAGAAPLDLLCILASSKSDSSILWGINMQGNKAGATPTSSRSYTM